MTSLSNDMNKCVSILEMYLSELCLWVIKRVFRLYWQT